ncbi:MAG: ABC transporter ATP-binding protein [Firmicutes bacterium]|nr:ABC transporter ATP-binding protein [Bacillota bacterium]
MALIELKSVSKVYVTGPTSFTALSDIDLSVESGDFVAVMGPSGSGKSTLLNILGLLDKPTSGTYLFEGENVAFKSDRELAHIRGQKIGFVFQFYNLIPRLTVLRNVEVPMIYAGIPVAERRQRAIEHLRYVGLENRINYYPNSLSGGETQRAAIARALVNNPKVILADEPTGNLDTKTGHEILDLLTELNRKGSTVILITHERDIANYAKRIIRIQDGRIRISKWSRILKSLFSR